MAIEVRLFQTYFGTENQYLNLELKLLALFCFIAKFENETFLVIFKHCE